MIPGESFEAFPRCSLPYRESGNNSAAGAEIEA